MNRFFIIYIFLLFVFFSYQLIFQTQELKNKVTIYLLYALVYSIIIHLSYNYFHKEPFTIEMNSQQGIQPLVDVISRIINPDDNTKNYKIKNDFDISNKDIIDENYNDIVNASDISLQKANIDAETSLNENINNNQKNQWVISPIIQKNNYDRVKQHNMYCAADYNKVTACCGQPPADVPSEYICGSEKPYCKGYVEFERWGTCDQEKVTTEPFTSEGSSNCQIIKPTEIGEYNVIGKFGQFVIWNMYHKSQPFSNEKFVIDNAGYLLLDNEMVPTFNSTTFQGKEINDCINSVVTDYVNKKMLPEQKSNTTTIIFPGINYEDNTQGSYSKTTNGSTIVDYHDTPFQWNDDMELSLGNVFFILKNPTQ